MPQRAMSITTADGTCPATLHTPDGAGPWPGVIVYTDAGGARPTFADMADRLAGLGYAVLVPDLYYRLGPMEPFDMATAFGDPDERERLMAAVKSVTKEAATRDTAAFLDALAAAPEADEGTVGTTGYYMGGGLSLTAAGRFPDRVAAAASFHGGQLATDAPDSPHLLAGSMKATVYVAGAENDGSFDDAQFQRLVGALDAAGVANTVVTYPAAHGFAVPDNPTFDEAAAARHWEALESLYGSTLARA